MAKPPSSNQRCQRGGKGAQEPQRRQKIGHVSIQVPSQLGLSLSLSWSSSERYATGHVDDDGRVEEKGMKGPCAIRLKILLFFPSTMVSTMTKTIPGPQWPGVSFSPLSSSSSRNNNNVLLFIPPNANSSLKGSDLLSFGFGLLHQRTKSGKEKENRI